MLHDATIHLQHGLACTKEDDCKSKLTGQNDIASPSTRSLLYLPSLEWQMSGNIHLCEVAKDLLQGKLPTTHTP